jgi:hypothetical protein
MSALLRLPWPSVYSKCVLVITWAVVSQFEFFAQMHQGVQKQTETLSLKVTLLMGKPCSSSLLITPALCLPRQGVLG